MHVITFGASEKADLLDACLKLRHRIFVERLGWRLPNADSRERDRYDDAPGIRHVAVLVDGCPVAYCRLMPVTGPNLLVGEFPQLIHDHVPADGVDGSRFCLDLDLIGRSGLTVPGVMRRLFTAMVLEVQAMGLSRIYGCTDVIFGRLMRRVGIALHRIGPTVDMGDCLVFAAYFNADNETLGRLGHAATTTRTAAA